MKTGSTSLRKRPAETLRKIADCLQSIPENQMKTAEKQIANHLVAAGFGRWLEIPSEGKVFKAQPKK